MSKVGGDASPDCSLDAAMGDTFAASKIFGPVEADGGDDPTSGGDCGGTEPSLVDTLWSEYGIDSILLPS